MRRSSRRSPEPLALDILGQILAAARRRGLPAPPFDLSLFHGLPGVAPATADPLADLYAIGHAFEATLARGPVGAFYTPAGVIRSIIAHAPPGSHVLDPAVGAGFFLLEAGQAAVTKASRRRIAERILFGVDINPRAVELARILVWLWSADARTSPAALRDHIRAGDALTLATPWPLDRARFSAVVGNPPFLDSERLCRDEPEVRNAARARFRTARGNYDHAVLFVERALELCERGGRVGMVLPARLLAADHAEAFRTLILQHTLLAIDDWSGRADFHSTAIPVITLILGHGRGDDIVRIALTSRDTTRSDISLGTLRKVPSALFAAAIQLGEGPKLDRLTRGGTLASVATISDGATTAEAYQIRQIVQDAKNGPRGASGESAAPRPLHSHRFLLLVNTGTIDPFRLLWGVRPIRYLGFRALRPVVRRTALAEIAPRRLEQALRDKVVVGGLAARLEAAVAPAGVLCGKSACQLLPAPGVCPHALAAYLNAPRTTDLYRAIFGLRGFSSQSMAIGARQLDRLPAPSKESLAPGAALSKLGLAAAHVERCDSWDADLDCAARVAMEDPT